ncbi:transposable element Tcb1 transposase [Trichonephila clavipes]|nr:transposable element Tcb1 transposase [Trichonephila clavipes]
MSRRKQQSAFDQVSEFDRGRMVPYQDCGLSFREIGSRVGRKQTTVMWICDRWMQEVSTRTIRRRLQQSGLSTRCPLLDLSLTQNHRRIRRQWCDERRVWVAEWNEVVFTDELYRSATNLSVEEVKAKTADLPKTVTPNEPAAALL